MTRTLTPRELSKFNNGTVRGDTGGNKLFLRLGWKPLFRAGPRNPA